MSDATHDPPLENRTLNNKLHQLALLAPDKFAAVEAYVDQALGEPSPATPAVWRRRFLTGDA